MPIKFRCKHCHQLLGIAVSRAGAVVDCPQCGRSLRVPELDGKTRKLPNAAAKTKGDSALISALSELSALNSTDIVPEQPPQIETAAPVEKNLPQPIPARVAKTDIEDPTASFMQLHNERTDLDDQHGPVTIDDPLADLAAWNEDVSPKGLSNDILAEIRDTNRHEQWASIHTTIYGIVAITTGLIVGWWLKSQDESPSGPTVHNGAQVIAKGQDIKAPKGANSTPNNRGIVQGRVEYTDASGDIKLDSGATILLLPTVRVGTIKFDGRSLKQKIGDPDRSATEAALATIGGFVTQADAFGQFSIPADLNTPCSLIAISRHQARPSDVKVIQDVTTTLQAYFESSSHLCGKLAVKITKPAAVGTKNEVNFRFDETN